MEAKHEEDFPSAPGMGKDSHFSQNKQGQASGLCPELGALIVSFWLFPNLNAFQNHLRDLKLQVL